MAAITEEVKRRCVRRWGRRYYEDANVTANLNADDIAAAVQAIDDISEGLPTAMPNPVQSVIANFNIALPQPFKGTATVEQKSGLLAIWASEKYGA